MLQACIFIHNTGI